jgi:hypothetical protein
MLNDMIYRSVCWDAHPADPVAVAERRLLDPGLLLDSRTVRDERTPHPGTH